MGCPNLSVRQSNPSGINSGLIGGNRGRGSFNNGLGGVNRTLRNKVLRKKLLRAFKLALGIGQSGLVFGQLGAGFGNIRFIGSRIQGEHQVTGFDKLPLFNMHRFDQGTGLGFHIHAG